MTDVRLDEPSRASGPDTSGDWILTAVASVVAAGIAGRSAPGSADDEVEVAMARLARDPLIELAAVLRNDEGRPGVIWSTEMLHDLDLATLAGWTPDLAYGFTDDLTAGPRQQVDGFGSATWWGAVRLRDASNSCLGIFYVLGRGVLPHGLANGLRAIALVLATVLGRASEETSGQTSEERAHGARHDDGATPTGVGGAPGGIDPDAALMLIVDHLEDPTMFLRDFGRRVQCNAIARRRRAVGTIAVVPGDREGVLALDVASVDVVATLLARVLVDVVAFPHDLSATRVRSYDHDGRAYRIAPVVDPASGRLEGFVVASPAAERDRWAIAAQHLVQRLRALAQFLDARLDLEDRTVRDELVRVGLTERQCDVAELLLHGARVPAIATRLGVSPNTVRAHLRGMFERADVSSQRELTDWLRETVRVHEPADRPPAGRTNDLAATDARATVPERRFGRGADR